MRLTLLNDHAKKDLPLQCSAARKLQTALRATSGSATGADNAKQRNDTGYNCKLLIQICSAVSYVVLL